MRGIARLGKGLAVAQDGEPSRATDSPEITTNAGWDRACHDNASALPLGLVNYAGPAMAATLQLESTLTDRYQTTVPDAVRRALKLGKRDKIRYLLQPDGAVVMARADGDVDDPALGAFLGFLASDLVTHPQRVTGLDIGLRKRLQSLVGKIEVDLDAALPDEE